MSAAILRPDHSAAGLADELAISAMAKALRGLSDFDLSDDRLRAIVYIDTKIPLPDIYKHDPAALRVECIRRKALANAQPAVLASAAK